MQQTVENGGFKQYFWNYEDTRFYDELRQGLQELNATAHLNVFERAFSLIQPHLTAMRQMHDLNDYFSKYKPLLKSDGTSDKLLNLDAEFYDLRPTLTQIRVGYMKRNPDKCGISSK
jgi:CRISPR/Cas system endoribonuclease Cas6 (RAMP superfamily)